MKRRLAFRQCDVERALRASKAVGAGRVLINLDGSIVIETEAQAGRPGEKPAGKEKVIVL